MLSFRLPATSIGRQLIRSITRNVSQSTTSNSIVHQVYPFPNIKITSNYHLNIKPYDVLDCPDGNRLRISLKSKDISKISSKVAGFLASFDATVKIDEHNIVIDTVDDLGTQVNADELANAVVCLIEVPIKSNLKVASKRDVNIENMYSDDINVITNDGDVTTKNIHSIHLNLIAQNGNIQCEGTTVSQKTDIRSYGKKNIHLNQVLGDSLTAISENGIISTNSCYAENSKFITQKGGLHLKNVHKKSELYLLDGGDLDVTGFHGTLNATTNGGTLNFQLTEMYGESRIEAQNPNQFNINISEFVEQHSCLQINANQITLDTTLEYLEKSQKDDGSGEELQTGNRDINDDQLIIRTNGNLKLGKLSWMDTMKLKMTATQKPDTK
ncbi:protein FAM185A [Contarinia nasturtii]|uniref:protein FAM185A n=1 Tax=Contarinia nasturtii TaxID=265458 RepID=UPI0012D4AD68|nr:protein FAM185A [Contarinia nasturtii]